MTEKNTAAELQLIAATFDIDEYGKGFEARARGKPDDVAKSYWWRRGWEKGEGFNIRGFYTKPNTQKQK